MEKPFFSEIEGLSRKDLSGLQLEGLKRQVEFLSESSPYYKRVFQEKKIRAEDIRGLDDLRRLPFVDKYMVGESQEQHPLFGEFLCVGEERLVKYFRTSGTTFHPRNFTYTLDDWWNRVCEVMARIMYSTGVRPEDRVFIAFPYSTFISLWTSHYASEKMGCMVIPGGGASTKERLNLMKQTGATVLCATPTYVHRLSTVAEEEGIDIKEIPIKIIHTGGEPLAAVPGSRKRLEEIWGAQVFDQYGFSEGFVPAGGECAERNGLHFTEDILIPEILDEKGEPVAPGEPGELVASNIASRTMPLLRFKTGDIVTYEDEPCPCGRNSIRIKVLGRTDDMIVIKGTNLFPAMIEEMVKRCQEFSSEFMIVLDEVRGRYELIIQVEPRGGTKFTRDEEASAIGKLEEMVRENLRIRPLVQVMEPKSLPRFEVKARRVVDKRPKEVSNP